MRIIQQTIKSSLLFLMCILAVAIAQAQRYEIRTTNRGAGQIGVEMRVTTGAAPGTADAVTDILFGIKWSAGYNVDLASTFTTSYNLRKSGTRMLKNGFHYQGFYAEPVPFNLPANWVVNTWTEILSISTDRTGTGTGVFEIVETGFDPTTDPNIGINLVDHTPVIVGMAGGVLLPVKLTSFEALPANRSVRLQWTTENELNNKGFEVQRATPPNPQFSTVGWVAGKLKNAGAGEYEFVDSDVAGQIKYIYRLNQIDNDGRSTYSASKTVSLDGSFDAAITIFPNPAGETLQVAFSKPASAQVTLQIMDAKGAVLQTKKASPQPGQQIALSTSDLARGQYFLVVQQQDGSVLFSKTFQKK